MPQLRLAVLGPPRVDLDGAAVEVDTRKAIALLAYLAVTGERHGREALAGLLWPEFDEAHARAALRRTLSALNKGLRGGWLVTDRMSIALDRDGLWLDLDRFRALLDDCGEHGHPPDGTCPACLAPLREAAALHRGDFLAGFVLRGADGFEDWQVFQAESLRRDLAGVLERLAAAEAAGGRWQEAIADAHRWLALDPLHEPAHRQLMRLYAGSGQRGAALRQYRACVRVLDEELGVPPLEETTALYQALTEGRPAPVAAAVEPGTRPTVAPTVGRALVGRSAEWAELLDAYAAARQGGRLVVLEGETGIGKTRLAEAFVGHAEAAGAATVATRCYEGESSLAYGPLVAGLRAAVARPGSGAWLKGLPAPWLAEAGRLLPELGALRPDLPTAPPLDSLGAQSRFLEGVSQMLVAALGGSDPGVLFLDDLHWADEATLDVLTYLARRLGGRSLCVVATWRSEQVRGGHRLRRLSAEAQRAGNATVLRLARLGELEVAELVGTVAPDRVGEAARLYRETEGLPLFLTEYLAATPRGDAGAPMPAGVRELLQLRLASVGEAGRQLLTTAAAIGRAFDFDTVRAASGRSEEEAVSGLEELVARGLVRELPGVDERADAGYDFSHELLRAVAYEETSLARRRLLHRRIAEALAGRARGHPDAGSLAPSIAHHWQLAGRDAEAAAASRVAGEHARALYANREAVAHFRAALALGDPDVAGLHEAIGDLETLLGDYDAALAAYETAAAHLDPEALAALEHKLGNLHGRRGAWNTAESHLEGALTLLQRAPPAAGDGRTRRARLLADWSLVAHRRGQPDRALGLADQALELAQAAGDEQALAQAHNIRGVLASRLGDRDGARRHLERSLALAGGLPDPSARIAALNNLALAHSAAGELDQALRHAEAALALCAEQGDRHREAALHNNLADLLHAARRPDPAMAHLKQAVAIFAEIGQPGALQPEIWKLVEW
jgi:DNA-binding SARP family transcriptional activator